jgi:hypothetical protein
MRFSTATLLALPLLAAAAQEASPLDQAKAQAQYWFDKISSYIPNPSKAHTPQAAAAKAGGRTLNILTLGNWENTIRSSVKPASTKPEEWWILVTGVLAHRLFRSLRSYHRLHQSMFAAEA